MKTMLNDNITWVWPNTANMKEMDCDQGNEWDELWKIKWMRRTTVDEMNGIDFYIKTQKRWSGGTIMWQYVDDKMMEQDGYTASPFYY